MNLTTALLREPLLNAYQHIFEDEQQKRIFKALSDDIQRHIAQLVYPVVSLIHLHGLSNYTFAEVVSQLNSFGVMNIII